MFNKSTGSSISAEPFPFEGAAAGGIGRGGGGCWLPDGCVPGRSGLAGAGRTGGCGFAVGFETLRAKINFNRFLINKKKLTKIIDVLFVFQCGTKQNTSGTSCSLGGAAEPW